MEIEGSSSDYTRIDNRDLSRVNKKVETNEDKRLKSPTQEYQLGEQKKLKLDGSQFQDKVELSSPPPQKENRPEENAVVQRNEAGQEQVQQRFLEEAKKEADNRQAQARKADQQKNVAAEQNAKAKEEEQVNQELRRKEENREVERKESQGPVRRSDDDPLRNLNLLA